MVKRGQSPGPEHVDIGDTGEQVWGVRVQSDGDGGGAELLEDEVFQGDARVPGSEPVTSRDLSPGTHGS